MSTGKIIYKAYKHYEKTGSLSKKDLKRIGGDELVGIGGDLYTVFGDPNSSIVDEVKAGIDLIVGTETNSKGDKAAAEAVSNLAQKFSSNSSVQDLLKGTGQLAALARNPNLKGLILLRLVR